MNRSSVMLATLLSSAMLCAVGERTAVASEPTTPDPAIYNGYELTRSTPLHRLREQVLRSIGAPPRSVIARMEALVRKVPLHYGVGNDPDNLPVMPDNAVEVALQEVQQWGPLDAWARFAVLHAVTTRANIRICSPCRSYNLAPPRVRQELEAIREALRAEGYPVRYRDGAAYTLLFQLEGDLQDQGDVDPQTGWVLTGYATTDRFLRARDELPTATCTDLLDPQMFDFRSTLLGCIRGTYSSTDPTLVPVVDPRFIGTGRRPEDLGERNFGWDYRINACPLAPLDALGKPYFDDLTQTEEIATVSFYTLTSGELACAPMRYDLEAWDEYSSAFRERLQAALFAKLRRNPERNPVFWE